ncbi:hypothetical protein BGZ73_005830 [Actinomortierella ambigua]|nr:hypothetical protein BGZ73_005830 [Actinomortierella ambigua]
MQSVGTFFSTVSKIYNEINPATLSGAIDVVVVEQPDGELACSPFHVRFGKLNLLRPQDKIVEMTVNGRVVDLPMKVGKAGEAFFVFQTEQDVPEEFATSPLAGPASDKSEDEIDFLDLSQARNKDKDLKKKKLLKDEEQHQQQRRHRRNKSQQQQQQQQKQQRLSEKNRGSQDLHDQGMYLEAGYVSAHSGHGTDFEDEKDWDQDPQKQQEKSLAPPSPSPSPFQSELSAGHSPDEHVTPRSGPSPQQGNRGVPTSTAAILASSPSVSSTGARHRSSYSVPSSPRLGPTRYDVRQVSRLDPHLGDDHAAPSRRRHSSAIKDSITKEFSEGYHPLTPISPDDDTTFGDGNGSGEGYLFRRRPSTTAATAGTDNVILDMTGYKTDDESEDLSDGETVVFQEHRHQRHGQRSSLISMSKESSGCGEPRTRKPRPRKSRAMRGIGEIATALMVTSTTTSSSSFEGEEGEGGQQKGLSGQTSQGIEARLPSQTTRNNRLGGGGGGGRGSHNPRMYRSGRERSYSLPNIHQLVLPERLDIASTMSTLLRELQDQTAAARKENGEMDEEDQRQSDVERVDSAIASSETNTPSSAKGPPVPDLASHALNGRPAALNPAPPAPTTAAPPPPGTTSHRTTSIHHHHRKPSSVRVNQAVNALSDTELEYQTPRVTNDTGSSEWTWGWGGLPVKNHEGMEEEEEENSMFQKRHANASAAAANREQTEEVSPKPAMREMEIGGQVYRLAISMCPGDDFGKDLKASEALFTKNQVSFEEFSQDPLKYLNDPNLVCLVNDKYFTWSVAGPQLASLLLFHQPLPDSTLHQLSAKDARSFHSIDDVEPSASNSSSRAAGGPPTRFSALSRWFRGSPSTSSRTTTTLTTTSSSATMISSISVSTTGGSPSSPSLEAEPSDSQRVPRSDKTKPHEEEQDSSEDEEQSGAITVVVDKQAAPHAYSRHERRYAKTLRLTSDQLKSLNLKRGANTLTFSVASSYQGKATCVAKLFLWQYDYQVVISDIDGTITKSDALGHLFTMAGKDWTHLGVAKLYTDIVNNGYHVLYLTSRAIGQADYTRKYLKGVEQDNYQLPDGPVIMSPDRLFTAFHREVIMRKPEEFKMACLRDIKRLFGDRNPFYAGFGNRYTDMLSYRSVSVPVSRIFTIDPGGEVKLELLSNFKSTSYIALNDLVHQMFPCQKVVLEYNDWNYWKPPLPTIELPLAPASAPQLPQAKVPIDSHGSTHSQPHHPGAIPVSPSASGGRLGVIRTLTNSLTSASSLKKRPSIPAFASSSSSSSTSPLGSSSSTLTTVLSAASVTMTTTMTTSTTTATAAASTAIQIGHSGDRPPASEPVNGHHSSSGAFAPGSPPSSAPARLDIATKTRRLSLSLMRYGSSSHNSSSSTGTLATTTTTSSQTTLVESTNGGVTSSYLSTLLSSSSSTSMAGATASSSSYSSSVATATIGHGLGASSLPSSPPRSDHYLSITEETATNDDDDTHRDKDEGATARATPSSPPAPSTSRSRGFSVSPPPLASRLSETLLPYLRGSSSNSNSNSSSAPAASPSPPPSASPPGVAVRGRSHSTAGSGGTSSTSGGAPGDMTEFALNEQVQFASDTMEPIVGSWPTSDRLARLHRHGGGFPWTGQGMEEQSVLLSPFTELGSDRRYRGEEEGDDDQGDEMESEEDDDLVLDEMDYEDDELELEEEEEMFPDEEPHLEAPFL